MKNKHSKGLSLSLQILKVWLKALFSPFSAFLQVLLNHPYVFKHPSLKVILGFERQLIRRGSSMVHPLKKYGLFISRCSRQFAVLTLKHDAERGVYFFTEPCKNALNGRKSAFNQMYRIRRERERPLDCLFFIFLSSFFRLIDVTNYYTFQPYMSNIKVKIKILKSAAAILRIFRERL